LATNPLTLVGFYHSNQVRHLSWNDGLNIGQAIEPVYQVFYNPRNTNYLLLQSQEDTLNQITLLRADFQQLLFDLSTLLPASEKITAVSPGF
jgi:hypothetical protein